METDHLNHDLKIKHDTKPPMDISLVLWAGIQKEGFILPPSLPLLARNTIQKFIFQSDQKSWLRWTSVQLLLSLCHDSVWPWELLLLAALFSFLREVRLSPRVASCNSSWALATQISPLTTANSCSSVVLPCQ